MFDEGILIKYRDHMGVQNLRPWTVYGRMRTLTRLGEWANSPVLYLTEVELKAWQTARSKMIQPESLRTETSHLRNFYGWAREEKYRVDDPAIRLIMPRVVRRLPRPIADALLAQAMELAPDDMAAILALAALAGLRACEIAVLDWAEVESFDQSQPHLEANGKGGKGRRVPISTALVSVLTKLAYHKGPVIPRLDGLPGANTSSNISKRANIYLHEMGIAETLHQCRHRFATATYRQCKDIRAVQELLGHASPTTTAIYAASSSAVAIDAVERAGNLALA